MLGMTFFVLLVSMTFRTTLADYQLVQDYSGDAFWQGFEFFTDPDPTDGHVQFQSLDAANATGLAGFIESGNSSLAVYMGVDTEQVAPQGRASVRVSSTQTFQHALVVADIAHMPGGVCGTWPAFWMLGSDWPNNGEIDIVEGVNDQVTNSMTLHTNSGPVISDGAHFSGELVTPDCDINAPGQSKNAGCSIGDISNLTFGSDFNSAGGGVFATEWTSQFIKIWYFPRGSFPDDIVSSNPNPSGNWGTPNSVFQGSFNIDDHFKNLQIIFDTTFCGQWAGQVWNTTSCASLAPTCEEYVANNPKDFAGAYWAINSLQVFQDDGQGGANTTSSLASADGGGVGSMVRRSRAVRSASKSGERVLPIYL
ncbi:hypothetical protein PV05_02272 [Exophiala xenobiotica]|uniref:endo-1,3(4)-beta-glucanase n=1 Tax=Exophiala xenobiotica TaxID=348802 RepID=A0A0D2ESK0_9EURO|nr:uncharacterized protein PV05_02272 [Exophiala xenobiotica]KIW57710.1 hypothetical protein PV05_02272 [Exophiala xenobiotica]